MFFSIIIPTLNEERYLPGLLSDLSKQSFRDFEVIVVDANSSDRTAQLALDFRGVLPLVRVFFSKRRNVAVQRNLGARHSSGRWLIFMDADDRLPVYFLEGVKYRIALTKADLFTCWCNVEGSDTSDKVIEKYLNLTSEINRLIDYPTALGAMIGIRRSKFEKSLKFKANLVPLEDGKFIRDAVARGLKFKIFRDPKYTYSLRRFKRAGKLKSLQKFATLHLKRITRLSIDQETEYPMGGEAQGINLEQRSFFGDLQKNIKELTKRPGLKKRIRSILALLENGI